MPLLVEDPVGRDREAAEMLEDCWAVSNERSRGRSRSITAVAGRRIDYCRAVWAAGVDNGVDNRRGAGRQVASMEERIRPS